MSHREKCLAKESTLGKIKRALSHEDCPDIRARVKVGKQIRMNPGPPMITVDLHHLGSSGRPMFITITDRHPLSLSTYRVFTHNPLGVDKHLKAWDYGM